MQVHGRRPAPHFFPIFPSIGALRLCRPPVGCFHRRMKYGRVTQFSSLPCTHSHVISFHTLILRTRFGTQVGVTCFGPAWCKEGSPHAAQHSCHWHRRERHRSPLVQELTLQRRGEQVHVASPRSCLAQAQGGSFKYVPYIMVQNASRSCRGRFMNIRGYTDSDPRNGRSENGFYTNKTTTYYICTTETMGTY